MAVPPSLVTVAIAPAARHTKSAECALTTRSLRDPGDLAISRLYKREDREKRRSISVRDCASLPDPKREESHGTPHDASVPRRPRRQPAPPARAPPRARGRRRGTHRRRRAARRRGRRDPRGGPHAAGGRAPGGDGRGVPARDLAPGLHLRARRHLDGGRQGQDLLPQRAGRHRVHGRGAARRRQGRRVGDDLRRRLLVPAGVRRRRRAEADDPVAEHGPLPGRPRCDRRDGLSRARRVLGRPDGRLSRGGRAGSASSAARTCSSTTRASPI